MQKPQGMCTVGNNENPREVVLGFLTEAAAKSFRSELIDAVIAENHGEQKQTLVQENIDAKRIAKLRKAFEQRWEYLDFTRDEDAWGREQYKHSHVQALWQGFLSFAMLITAPTGYKWELTVDRNYSGATSNAASREEFDAAYALIVGN